MLFKAASSDTILNITSQSAASAFMEGWAVAPLSVNGFVLEAVRLYTDKALPLAMIFSAIGVPRLPRPINPIFIAFDLIRVKESTNTRTVVNVRIRIYKMQLSCLVLSH